MSFLSTSAPPRKGLSHPRKKALIIAVAKHGAHECIPLTGPHTDAVIFQDFLKRRYGYLDENIVMMLDSDHSGGISRLEPTRENIIQELQKLVQDAQPDDRFVLLYSGHSGQIASRLEPDGVNKEEDGMDEVIYPVDYNGDEDKLIRDDDLRRILVDSLPIGTRLTAIFDCCHSGTLLDLKHYRCNQVYVPWISKGLRRSLSFLARQVRKDGAFAGRRQSSGTHVYHYGHTSSPKHKAVSFSGDDPVTLGSSKTAEKSNTSPVRPKSPMVTPKRGFLPLLPELHIPGRESPTCFLDECDGFCSESPTERASVVSISAGKDFQTVWEGPQGESMTQDLVDILDQDLKPTYSELMTSLSHRIYKRTLSLHKQSWSILHYTRALKQRLKDFEIKGDIANMEKVKERLLKPVPPTERENFQDPQLGSLKKLNTGSRFML